MNRLSTAYSPPLARGQQNTGRGNFHITFDKEKPTSHSQDNVLTCAMGYCRLLQGEDDDSNDDDSGNS